MESSNPRSKRKRKAPTTLKEEYGDLDGEELRMIRQAVENSKTENISIERRVEEAPVFHPTEEEFQDPLKYINRSFRISAENFPNAPTEASRNEQVHTVFAAWSLLRHGPQPTKSISSHPRGSQQSSRK